MKKILILGLEKNKEEITSALREAGVLHIEKVKKPESQNIETIKQNISKLNKVISILDTRKTNLKKNKVEEDPNIIAQNIVSLMESKENTIQQIISLNKDKEQLLPLKNFEIDDLNFIRKNGIDIKFYNISLKDLQKIPKDIIYEVVNVQKSKCIIAVIKKGTIELDYDEYSIPDSNLNNVIKKIEELESKLNDIEKKLDENTAYRDLISTTLDKNLNDLEYKETFYGMGQDESLCYLKGYCPVNELDKLEEKRKELNLGISIEDPKEEDATPTLVQNPKWLKIIEPLFSFMNVSPGYYEYDVSFWFLISLTLFFAMLIGDGGYGLIFLIMTAFLRKKMHEAPKEPFILFFIFSVATVIWGAITGTWFGEVYFTTLPVIKDVIVPELNAYADSSVTIMKLSFLIGIIHITIAHIWRVIRVFPSFEAVSQIGWIILIWYLYFLVNSLVLGKPLPHIALLITGISIAFIFASIKKFTFESLIVHVISFVLSIIGAFGDIVSYIRLFAVGTASLSVAISCNTMAKMFGFDGFTNILISVLILFIGHALNLVLGGLSVIVHGVRLNMLEFSGHLDMTWSGSKYLPFKNNINKVD